MITETQNELIKLRVGIARLAQGTTAEEFIPGSNGRKDLNFEQLTKLASSENIGWNRLLCALGGVIQFNKNPW